LPARQSRCDADDQYEGSGYFNLKKARLIQCQSPTMTIPIPMVDDCSKAEFTSSEKDDDEDAGQLDYEHLVNLHAMR
jgi:hypothetical protein